MMLPTHALAGMALALPVAAVAPEAAPVAFLAGLLGGVVPDLDLYVGHRRTLHFPVYYTVGAAVAVPVAAVVATPAAVAVAVFLAAAALHCVADVFGGGLELRPWRATADHAVYDHFNGRWIAPRRWVRYDGAPEDFLLSAALAGALWGPVGAAQEPLVAGAVAVAAAYAALRRVLPGVVELLVDRLPDPVVGRLPARYRESGASAGGRVRSPNGR
ncbi:metal-dependent hydrolase [Halobaculum lipolyticum]|uniref:Metal-dependent hydrolase n=1 Tax=Halobaculum lipolyticum TaxID=3032001 RepID=A0ABD5WBE5_9EURY|nr:metal-dependent hydrolase [Halobaculum sp. DT31]